MGMAFGRRRKAPIGSGSFSKALRMTYIHGSSRQRKVSVWQ